MDGTMSTPYVFRRSPLKNGYGWNVKPQAIMQLLDQGFDEVIWIDSDVIVKRNLLPLFSQCSATGQCRRPLKIHSQKGATTEMAFAHACGAFPLAESYHSALNSGVLRVTKDNYRLMERWWALLQSEKYQKAQQTPWQQRPIHMFGDQDVLTALLTSQEFSHVPIHILRRGKHIIQFDGIYGYTIAERMRNLLRRWSGLRSLRWRASHGPSNGNRDQLTYFANISRAYTWICRPTLFLRFDSKTNWTAERNGWSRIMS